MSINQELGNSKNIIKKIAIIGTNGLPGRYGGWDQLLNHLTYQLKNEYSITVYTSKYNAVKGLKEFNGAKIKIIPLKANGVQSIPYDIVSMIDAVINKYEILLVLGTSGCIFLPFLKPFSKKIILNIDGAEWKRGKWSNFAKWFLKISEKIGVIFSDTVIADSKVIQNYIYETYKKNSELIEYGGDNVKFVNLSKETSNLYNIQKNSYAFKVCRIEPENNIDMILEAFSKTIFKIIIIGNWNNSNYGRNLRKSYSKYENLILLDPIYEQEILDELRGNCGLYIHGHSVGGTNPSLVEAMSLRLCCVVYKVSYNIETTENKALYFNSSNQLLDIIRSFENNFIDTQKYANDLYEIAKRRYKWSIIVDKYKYLFE